MFIYIIFKIILYDWLGYSLRRVVYFTGFGVKFGIKFIVCFLFCSFFSLLIRVNVI